MNQNNHSQFPGLDSWGWNTNWESLWQNHKDEWTVGPAQPARVIAVHRDRYVLHTGVLDISGECSGKMLFQMESAVDYPTVGDWVAASVFEDDNLALIHAILPRQSILKRKMPGKKSDCQLVAANVDVAFIMQGLDGNYNLRRLERYLSMVYDAGVKPVVVLSKSDLLEPEQKEEVIQQIQLSYPGLDILAVSQFQEDSLQLVEEMLEKGRSFSLIGSSGVGKTTLINRLLGSETFRTGAVRSSDQRGRHTTTHRQIVQLESGALLVDTPGMRELGNMATETGIETTFSEIQELSSQCRFSDCQHELEKGCAIREAIEEGRLDMDRFQSYLKLQKESRFHEMTYLEKRQNDRKWGKLIKDVKKQKRFEKG